MRALSFLLILIISSASISSAQEVRLVGSYDTPGSAHSVDVQGDYCAVACRQAGLIILDITNPTEPSEIWAFETEEPELDVIWDVEFQNDYLYAFGSGIFYVFDISNIDNPSLMGTYNTQRGGYSGMRFDIKDENAYIADNADGLRIIDHSNPLQPIEVGLCDAQDRAMGVMVNGGYAYIADRFAGFSVMDVSDVHNPEVVGTCLLGPYRGRYEAYDLDIYGSHCYVANGIGGLYIVDVTDPTNPRNVGSCNTEGDASGIASMNALSIMAVGVDGLKLIDTSDPEQPTEISDYDTPSQAEDLTVIDGYAFIADGGSVLILDISDFMSINHNGRSDPSKAFALLNIYPNPFNSRTAIRYSLPVASDIRLAVYDLTGRLSQALFVGQTSAGNHEVSWAPEAGAGLYFVRLEAGEQVAIRRVMVVR